MGAGSFGRVRGAPQRTKRGQLHRGIPDEPKDHRWFVEWDIYVVASKTVPSKPVPIVLSAGIRETNAELWGMGGNAPDWQARGFAAVAVVFKGPAKSTIIVGSEVAQQPHHPLNFPTLNIPTTLTYCARFIPSSRYKLNFDVGGAQVAARCYRAWI
jgi:hypothetical protein